MSLTIPPLFNQGKLGLLVAIVLAGGMWMYVDQVMVRYQQQESAALLRPRGNLSDLYPRWLGARELILRGRDPYSEPITREIQTGYYGRPLDRSLTGDPLDQQRFAYPVYVVFLLAPFIGLPFPVVQDCFRWLLGMAAVSNVLFWLRAMRWTLRWRESGVPILLTLGSLPVLQGLKLQQLSLAVSGLLAAAVALIAAGRLWAAGALLAAATIKPQLALPLALWLLLWACGDWRRRSGLVWSFGGAMTLAVLAGQWVLPGWIGEFGEALSAYRQYTGGAVSVLTVLTNSNWSAILTGMIVLGLAVLAWWARREAPGSPLFTLLSALVLCSTVMLMPTTALYNQILLLPAVLLLLRRRKLLLRESLGVRLAAWAAGLSVFWPYLAALVLACASLSLPAQEVQRAWDLPLRSSLAAPLLVTGLLAWVTLREFRRQRDSLQWKRLL